MAHNLFSFNGLVRIVVKQGDGWQVLPHPELCEQKEVAR